MFPNCLNPASTHHPAWNKLHLDKNCPASPKLLSMKLTEDRSKKWEGKNHLRFLRSSKRKEALLILLLKGQMRSHHRFCTLLPSSSWKLASTPSPTLLALDSKLSPFISNLQLPQRQSYLSPQNWPFEHQINPSFPWSRGQIKRKIGDQPDPPDH